MEEPTVESISEALSDLWLQLTLMDGRRREVKRAEAAYHRLERLLRKRLQIDILIGPADIAEARERAGL